MLCINAFLTDFPNLNARTNALKAKVFMKDTFSAIIAKLDDSNENDETVPNLEWAVLRLRMALNDKVVMAAEDVTVFSNILSKFQNLTNNGKL